MYKLGYFRKYKEYIDTENLNEEGIDESTDRVLV